MEKEEIERIRQAEVIISPSNDYQLETLNVCTSVADCIKMEEFGDLCCAPKDGKPKSGECRD